MNTHAHKVFLITGVSSGFGLAFSQAALAAGHTVVGTVRRESECAAITLGSDDFKNQAFNVIAPQGRDSPFPAAWTAALCACVVGSFANTPTTGKVR